MGSLGPLPPIGASTDLQPTEAPRRTAAQQADVEAELEALHHELGVKPGAALKENMKPKLEAPMPALELATAPLVDGISCHAPVVAKPDEPAEDALR